MNQSDKNKTDALSDGDIERIATLLDNRLAPLATKQELLATKQELKQELKAEISGLETILKTYIHEGVETIMDGIDKLSEQMAEKQKVEKMESWIKKAQTKLGVKYEW